MGVNVSARFGKNDELYNGLNHQEKDLLDDPGTLRVAVIKYRTKFAKEDFEHGGARTPTVKIEHIEPLYASAASTASTLAQEAYKARTGGELQPDLFDDPDEDDEPADAGDKEPTSPPAAAKTRARK